MDRNKEFIGMIGMIIMFMVLACLAFFYLNYQSSKRREARLENIHMYEEGLRNGYQAMARHYRENVDIEEINDDIEANIPFEIEDYVIDDFKKYALDSDSAGNCYEYDSGHEDGRDAGYREGYDEGYAEGYYDGSEGLENE